MNQRSELQANIDLILSQATVRQIYKNTAWQNPAPVRVRNAKPQKASIFNRFVKMIKG